MIACDNENVSFQAIWFISCISGHHLLEHFLPRGFLHVKLFVCFTFYLLKKLPINEVPDLIAVKVDLRIYASTLVLFLFSSSDFSFENVIIPT